jgi:hypothetical protein
MVLQPLIKVCSCILPNDASSIDIFGTHGESQKVVFLRVGREPSIKVQIER